MLLEAEPPQRGAYYRESFPDSSGSYGAEQLAATTRRKMGKMYQHAGRMNVGILLALISLLAAVVAMEDAPQTYRLHGLAADGVALPMPGGPAVFIAAPLPTLTFRLSTRASAATEEVRLWKKAHHSQEQAPLRKKDLAVV